MFVERARIMLFPSILSKYRLAGVSTTQLLNVFTLYGVVGGAFVVVVISQGGDKQESKFMILKR